MSERVPYPLASRTISRTMDPRHLTAVANDDDVRPTIGGAAMVDLAPLLANPENLAFETTHGGFVCVALGSGRYDVHTLFLPAGRGRDALTAMTEALDLMFTTTDCTELRTTIPASHRGARAFAEAGGFERRFRSRLPWTNGVRIDAEFFALALDRWALRSERAGHYGAWFHATLAYVKANTGSTVPPHPDDLVHDQMVGATAMMLQMGQAEKAVRFYNIWAAIAGYQTLTLLRLRPTIVDLVDAIVEAGPAEMEVLLCR